MYYIGFWSMFTSVGIGHVRPNIGKKAMYTWRDSEILIDHVRPNFGKKSKVYMA
jgi:hypothetical protein